MGSPSPERLALLRKMLAAKGIERREQQVVPRRGREGPARVSFGQRRLWFEEELHPGTSLYNDSLCVSLAGAALDEDLFERSLQAVVGRHEILRTVFENHGGEPMQVVLPPGPNGTIPLRRVDLRDLGPAEAERELERLLLEDVRGPFALDRLPLARATLARRADDAWEFALTMHHIVSDGVSYAILWRELGLAYEAGLRGAEAALEGPPVQYADYAEWERSRMDEERLERGVRFWQEALGTDRPEVALPLDFPRPASAAHRGAFHRFRFPAALARALDEHCRREQVTSNWVLLAAYYALLHAGSGQTDVTVGMPSSTRSERELEGVIGFFVQTMLLRNDLSGDPSFRELVARTRRRALEMSRWEDIPFDRIVQAIRPRGGPEAGRAPLIQAWIAPMKDLMPKLELPGMRSSYRIVDPKNARFDLCLILDETSEGVEAYFEYDVDLFRPATIRALAERFQAILRRVIERPEARLGELADVARAVEVTREPAGAGRREGPRKKIAKARRRMAEG